MQIPREAITELKLIHRELAGETLTEAEAQMMASDLYRLFLAVYEPVPSEWLRTDEQR